MTDYEILHVFADTGVESEALSAYGRVIRFGLNPRDLNASEPVKADANHMPLKEGYKADLAVLHPPCTRWALLSQMAENVEPEDYPNLIPLAREIGETYAEHYIIENVPKAPLRDPVILTGRMFNIPVKRERAFETSFPVDQPPRQKSLDMKCSPYDRPKRSLAWWKAAYGYSGEYPKDEFVMAGIPRAYVDHIAMAWLETLEDTRGELARDYERAGHDNTAELKVENKSLTDF